MFKPIDALRSLLSLDQVSDHDGCELAVLPSKRSTANENTTDPSFGEYPSRIKENSSEETKPTVQLRNRYAEINKTHGNICSHADRLAPRPETFPLDIVPADGPCKLQ